MIWQKRNWCYISNHSPPVVGEMCWGSVLKKLKKNFRIKVWQKQNWCYIKLHAPQKRRWSLRKLLWKFVKIFNRRAWQNCKLMYIKNRVTSRCELQNPAKRKIQNKIWMAFDKTEKCAKLRTRCSARLRVWVSLKYTDENPVFLEKLNSANGPDRDWTEKQTPSMFDQENLNLKWIQQNFFWSDKKAQTNSSLLQNNFFVRRVWSWLRTNAGGMD